MSYSAVPEYVVPGTGTFYPIFGAPAGLVVFAESAVEKYR
jgi:hypothetical protein